MTFLIGIYWFKLAQVPPGGLNRKLLEFVFQTVERHSGAAAWVECAGVAVDTSSQRRWSVHSTNSRCPWVLTFLKILLKKNILLEQNGRNMKLHWRVFYTWPLRQKAKIRNALPVVRRRPRAAKWTSNWLSRSTDAPCLPIQWWRSSKDWATLGSPSSTTSVGQFVEILFKSLKTVYKFSNKIFEIWIV